MKYTKTKRFKKLAKEYLKNDDKLMDKPKPMTAQEAYDKTEKLIKVYSNGDLLGGNPMQYIEKYASNQVEEQSIQFAMWILDNGYTPHPDKPHKWAKISLDGSVMYKTYTEVQMYEKFKKQLNQKQ